MTPQKCNVATIGAVLFLCALASMNARASAAEDKEMREIDRIDKLAAKQRTINGYTYVPRITEENYGARGYRILKKRRTVYKYLPVPVEAEKTWLVEPLVAEGRRKIPTKPDRYVEQIFDPFGPRLPIGTDVTGDGIPDLIICSYTRGAHCCFNYTVLSLGKTFAKLPTISGLDSQFKFKDLDGDGVSEVVGYDFNFHYWKASFADSPAPLVILTFRHGRPVLDVRLMKTPPLSDTEFDSISGKLRHELQEELAGQQDRYRNPPKFHGAVVSSAIWRDMLDLIYTGNGTQAYKLFDLVWPPGVKGYWHGDLTEPEDRDTFLASFKQQLAKSDYWGGIRKLNGWKK